LKEVPPVFVSVASKGFRLYVSPLFAALMGSSISVADKGFKIQPRWNVGRLNVKALKARKVPLPMLL
jgi:hypothetical protein